MPRRAVWWTAWACGSPPGSSSRGISGKDAGGFFEEGEEIKTLESRVTSAVFLILSGLIMAESVRLKQDSIHDPGPGFVPFFLGLALAILSVLSLLFPVSPKGAAFWNDWQKGKSIFYIFAGLIVYLLFFRIVGFYLDTFLLMIYLLKLSGEKGYRRPLLISLLTVGVTYILFYKLLFIPFPQGRWGI